MVGHSFGSRRHFDASKLPSIAAIPGPGYLLVTRDPPSIDACLLNALGTKVRSRRQLLLPSRREYSPFFLAHEQSFTQWGGESHPIDPVDGVVTVAGLGEDISVVAVSIKDILLLLNDGSLREDIPWSEWSRHARVVLKTGRQEDFYTNGARLVRYTCMPLSTSPGPHDADEHMDGEGSWHHFRYNTFYEHRLEVFDFETTLRSIPPDATHHQAMSIGKARLLRAHTLGTLKTCPIWIAFNNTCFIVASVSFLSSLAFLGGHLTVFPAPEQLV